MQETTLIIVFSIVFAFYNYAYIKLVENILASKRFKSPVAFYVSSIITSAIGTSLFTVLGTFSTLGYIIIIVFFFLEITVLFKNYNLIGVLVCTLSITLHIFCLRSVISSVFSIVTEMSVYDIMQDASLFWVILIATAVLGTVASILCNVIIPRKYYQIINQNVDHMGFLFAFCAMFNFYMIINALKYISAEFAYGMVLEEIILAIIMLGGLYVALFMLIRFDKLLGYQEKLQQDIDRDKVYKHSLLTQCDMTFEFNCTKDIIMKSNKKEEVWDLSEYKKYSDYLQKLIKHAVHPKDADKIRQIAFPQNIIKAYVDGKREIELEYRSKDIDEMKGEYEWYSEHIHLERKASGDIVALSTINIVTEKKEREARLKKKAETDTLTGAYNKTRMAEKVSDILSAGGTGTLVMFDLDNFKGINDNMGHAFGDDVLKEVYEKVKALFRERDLLGRIGGDEFVLFMSSLTNKEDINKRATQICKTIEKTYTQGDNSVHISTSVGLSIAPDDSNDYDELLHYADMAMYAAKNAGKNNFKYYDKEITKGFRESDSRLGR